MEHLCPLVLSLGAAPAAVDRLMSDLTGLHSVPGMDVGLPIGPEASAPLGTVALLPLDRRLAGLGFIANRWMDDVIVPVPEAGSSPTVLEAAGHQLTWSGQALNLDKSRFVPLDDESDKMVSLGGGGTMIAADPSDALAASALLKDPRGVPMALGLLRSREDAGGVATLKANRWIVDRFPKQVGKYLAAVARQVGSWDWILDIVFEATTPSTAAAQLHLTRVLPRSVLSSGVGDEMFGAAQALDRVDYSPLADQLFAAHGRSQVPDHLRRRRAAELAEELGELNAQRGLLSAFARGGVDRTGRAALRHLEANQHELAMTVDWALAS